MAAIVVQDLRREYGALAAVDGLSFDVAEGELFALLGPNGAGKTTTVEILTGHRRRTSGDVRVLGFDPQTGGRAYRRRIGVVLQSAGFEEDFTVRELVGLQRRLYPRVHDTDAVIELVGLTDKCDARVKVLSGGQRRRLDLALGIIGAPDLLFLDEPTTGFDPAARHHAWALIRRLRELGTTVLLTTHYMDEAEHLADRVAVIKAGRLVALGRPDELGGAAAEHVLRFALPAGTVWSDLPTLSGRVQRHDAAVVVHTRDPLRDTHTVTGWAIEHGVALPQLTLTRPTLEDVYLKLTGGDDDDS
ncbi:ABC transporter ATP-binding protein [Dactylosporangium sp. NBC_01737]|uniref:ABC transporter ATP-binding protein n=1 Tax=Dactylosporangium sp. NBC_01737 TaxID=2975959 RepID=UPI002E148E90|nr:ABC transporter ATP-binding protein [Dactylosporangium sp. NBC_01737]